MEVFKRLSAGNIDIAIPLIDVDTGEFISSSGALVTADIEFSYYNTVSTAYVKGTFSGSITSPVVSGVPLHLITFAGASFPNMDINRPVFVSVIDNSDPKVYKDTGFQIRFGKLIPRIVVSPSIPIPASGDYAIPIDVILPTQDGLVTGDPDADEVALQGRLVNAGSNSTAFYDDEALTTPATASTTFTPAFYKLVKISTGHYRTYFKSTSALSEDLLQWTVKYSEFSLTADEYKAASRIMPECGAAEVTLDDSNANKDIIAEALKERDVSGTGAVSGSIHKDIMDNVDGNETKIDIIDTNVDTVLTDLAVVDSNVDTIVAKLPTGTISDLALTDTIDTGLTVEDALELASAMADGRLKKRVVGSDTFLDIYRRNSTSILSTVKITQTERTREALP